MALWTDIIDPETLTGYARASMNAYEARKGHAGALVAESPGPRHCGELLWLAPTVG